MCAWRGKVQVKLVMEERGGERHGVLVKTNNDLRRDQLMLACINMMDNLLLVMLAPRPSPFSLPSPHSLLILSLLCCLPAYLSIYSSLARLSIQASTL